MYKRSAIRQWVFPSKPTWDLEYGFGINDAGMISGRGRTTVKGKSTWSAVLVIPNQ